jgi:hypothetical protein
MHVHSLALGFASAALLSMVLWAQGDKPKRFAYPTPSDPQAAMARFMATCKPGPAHARLSEMLGSYETKQRMWMEGPGGKPLETKGTAEIGWLVEGRWLTCKWTGEMMGKKINGTWILGYDNFKERFVICFVDSFQTCMNTASGLFDQSGDDLILWGTIDEPMTPEQDKMVKYVFRSFGKDTHTFEVHDMMIGESNTKVVEIEYTRKK